MSKKIQKKVEEIAHKEIAVMVHAKMTSEQKDENFWQAIAEQSAPRKPIRFMGAGKTRSEAEGQAIKGLARLIILDGTRHDHSVDCSVSIPDPRMEES